MVEREHCMMGRGERREREGEEEEKEEERYHCLV